MKPRKRYFSEQELIKRIDKDKAQADKRLKEAAQLDNSAESFVRESVKFDQEMARSMVHRANLQRDAAARKRKRAHFFMVRAKRLGQALAEFRTKPMTSVLGENPSVQL